MIGVGVDFGTSNSTIAWFDGKTLRCVAVEGAGPILPTAIHLSRNYVGTTGMAAIERYVADNSARLVHLVPEIIGQAGGEIMDRSTDSTMSELTTSRNLVFGPLMDHGLPGRLFLGLKRLLGNPQVDRLSVFDRPYRLVALLTPVLQRMRESLERELQAACGRAHVGRPVDFEGSDVMRNALAPRRLAEACEHAGFRQIEFYPEPVAATLSYLWQQPAGSSGTVLTVDFGGGTLDLCVLEYSNTRFRVLSTAGDAVGGDRIDQAIVRRMLFPLLGEGERWPRIVDGRLVESQFPFAEYAEGILNWATAYTLNQNRYKTRLTELVARGGPAAVKFERLKDLINYNYAYTLFNAVKRAKADLSMNERTCIDVPELNLSVPFTRHELNDVISPMMKRLGQLIQEVLNRARKTKGSVDLVVRTGGSSQMIAVRDLLEQEFPGKVTTHDPFTSVAGGLAIASYHDYRFASPDTPAS